MAANLEDIKDLFVFTKYEDLKEDYEEEEIEAAYKDFLTTVSKSLMETIPELYNQKNYDQIYHILHKAKTTFGYLGSDGFYNLISKLSDSVKKEGKKYSIENFEAYYPIFMKNIPIFYEQCKDRYERIRNGTIDQNIEEEKELEKEEIFFEMDN
ncbi:MAG: hypothetical protein MJ252_30935, partial [archaeon]|nr:hypothetical protein [archaeon]